MKRIIATLLLALAAGSLAAAEEPLLLKGKMGIGVDSMPGLVPDQSPILSNLVKTPDTVVFRYWCSEKFSVEGQLAANYSSAPNGGTGTAATKAWGLGAACKWNVKRPTETSLFQLMAGLDYAQNSAPDQSGALQTSSTFSLFVGPACEYFIPAWRSVSVEASIRLRVASTQAKSDASSAAAQSSSAIDISGNGFTPLNLSLHYYF